MYISSDSDSSSLSRDQSSLDQQGLGEQGSDQRGVGEQRLEELTRQFRAFLEERPELPPPEEGEDSFSLHAALVALKNEVRIEARQFKGALDDFRQAFAAIDRNNSRLADSLAHLTAEREDERRNTLTPLLKGLLELYDKLEASIPPEESPPAGFWARARRREHKLRQAHRQGQLMLLARLETLLAEHGMQPMHTLGAPFDPEQMRAIERIHRPELADGVVVEEYRRGFTREGVVFRPAEVAVNR